jgi:hypothetical protein
MNSNVKHVQDISKPYQSYVDRIKQAALDNNEQACAARQLLIMHAAAASKDNTVFLELGTDRGQATKVILNAFMEHQGTWFLLIFAIAMMRGIATNGHLSNQIPQMLKKYWSPHRF